MVVLDQQETEDGVQVTYCQDCPYSYVPPIAGWLLQYYPAYERGGYLHKGALLDQPNFYLEGMRLVEGAISEIKSQQIEEQKRELEAMKRKRR